MLITLEFKLRLNLHQIHMKFNKYTVYSFIVLFFLHHTLLLAQNQASEFNIDPSNIDKLEQTIFKKINEIRTNKRMPALIWDNLIYRATKDHANYLVKEKKISHFQESEVAKTPDKRVRIHGGVIYDFVGENIQSISLMESFTVKGKKQSIGNFEQAAEAIVLLWKESNNDYKKIISKDYNYSALSVAYDQVNQRIVAVQLFAYSYVAPTITEYPDYSSSLFQTNTQLPYGLKKKKEKKQDKLWIEKFKTLQYDKTFLVGNFKDAKQLFKGRNSGIAFEFIPISDYDKGSEAFLKTPNRRNGAFELNGELSKPIYRRNLFKYSKENIPREYLIYSKLLKIKKAPEYFALPLPLNTQEKEYNIFLIKNKRLLSHRSYINLPMKFFEMPFPELSYKTGFNQIEPSLFFDTEDELDTIFIHIDYPAGCAELERSESENIINTLEQFKDDLMAIKASAYTSIEGDSISNKQLAEERWHHVYNLIKPEIKEKLIDYDIIMGESWDLFYKQIKGTKLAHLRRWNKTRIRNYVNQHKHDSLVNQILNQQRYVTYQLIYKKEVNKTIISKQTALARFDSLVNKLRKKDLLNKNEYKELEEAQLAYYHDIILEDTTLSKPFITLPYIFKHPEFKYHESLFRYLVLKNISDHELYNEWHKIGFSPYLPSKIKKELIYNNNVLIYNNFFNGISDVMVNPVSCYQTRKRDFYFENIKTKSHEELNAKKDAYYILKELGHFIKQQRKVNGDSLTHELWKFYYMHSMKTLNDEVPKNMELKGYLKGFKKYYHPNDNKLTAAERLKLAYVYSAINEYHQAIKLLEPIMYQDNPNAETVKLYITLKYFDYGDSHLFNEFLMSCFIKLGKYEWCDIWHNPLYLNSLLLEDFKLKEFYNCNCN